MRSVKSTPIFCGSISATAASRPGPVAAEELAPSLNVPRVPQIGRVTSVPRPHKPDRSYKARKSLYPRTCARLQIRNLLHMLGHRLPLVNSLVGTWIIYQYLFTYLCQRFMSDGGLLVCCCSLASQVAFCGYFSASLAFRWSYAWVKRSV